jgi:hypothetical protein
MLLVVAMCHAAKYSDDVMDRDLARTLASRDEPEIAWPPAAGRPLRTLDLDQAADLLGVTPVMLAGWEARYGFPTSSPSEQRYSEIEVLALRDTLEDGISIASAVNRAREKCRHRRAPVSVQSPDRRDGGLAS